MFVEIAIVRVMGMRRTCWALYELSKPLGNGGPTHWLVRVVRPGAPGYLVQLGELAEALADVRARVVVDSALAAYGGASPPTVRRLGWAAPLFADDEPDSVLMALHGCEHEVWVAWPRDEARGDDAMLSVWPAAGEEEFWAWVEDNENDSTIETLARPATRLRVRSWTPWDFRLWDSDPLLVPEMDWLAGDAWEAWSRHDEVDLESLRGPRGPTLELSAAEHRAICVRRFDRLIEQRRAVDGLRARTWELEWLARIDTPAMLVRMDALMEEIRAEGPEAVDWVAGLTSSLSRASDVHERDAWLGRARTDGDPMMRELVRAYERDAEQREEPC